MPGGPSNLGSAVRGARRQLGSNGRPLGATGYGAERVPGVRARAGLASVVAPLGVCPPGDFFFFFITLKPRVE